MIVVPLTQAQMTLIAIFLLISHNLVQEGIIQGKSGINPLKVRFNSVFGYYIEVTKSQLDKVPPEYTRKQTIANGERYIAWSTDTRNVEDVCASIDRLLPELKHDAPEVTDNFPDRVKAREAELRGIWAGCELRNDRMRGATGVEFRDLDDIREYKRWHREAARRAREEAAQEATGT